MAKSSITNISTTGTFQNWFDKTNELVNLVKSDILTASLATTGGDVTIGNTTLQGNFSANNVIASELLRVDKISPKVGSLAIELSAPIDIITNQIVLSRLSSTSGPKLSFYNTVDTDWQVGFENNTTKNFIISNGGATLKLTPTGNIEITGILSGTAAVANTVTLVSTDATNATHYPVFVDAVTGNEQIRTDNGFTYNPSTGTLTSTIFVGNLTGNVTGNVTGSSGSVTSFTGRTTNDLTEGTTNLYFTTARARSTLSQGTGVTYNSTTGAISIGQAVATTSNVTFGNLNTSGTIVSTGAISSNGDITAFASSSDIRKKENIVRIDNALEKVLKIGGYTYNFKNDDRRITGVIAQELEQVLPEAVYEIDDEDFGGKSKAVRYGNIVGLLIEAIKELKSELDELKGR